MIFWAPEILRNSASQVLTFKTRKFNSTHRHRPSPLYSLCSHGQWPHHPDISICWGLQKLHIHIASWSLFRDHDPDIWSQASASLHGSISLGFPPQLRLHFHWWPLLASQSAKLQLFSMTPLCLQNQLDVRDSDTLLSWLPAWPMGLAPSEQQL